VLDHRYGAAVPSARRWSAAVQALAATCSVSIVACAAGSSGPSDLDTASIAPTVVDVEAQACARPQPRRGVATQVGDDLFLTAAHVVGGDLRTLRVNGAPGQVVEIDERLDLALVASGAADALAPGWWTDMIRGRTAPTVVEPGAVTIHRPDGVIETRLERALTLRVHDVTAGVLHERPSLELDVVVARGVSGSPVVDADGRMIGVLVLSREPAGVSYATQVSPAVVLSDPPGHQERTSAETGSTTRDAVAALARCP
jgi:S1-C subfamily serine protease